MLRCQVCCVQGLELLLGFEQRVPPGMGVLPDHMAGWLLKVLQRHKLISDSGSAALGCHAS